MLNFHRNRKTGLPPGTLADLPAEQRQEAAIHLIHYSEEFLNEKELEIEKLKDLRKYKGTVWLNVTGLWDSTLLRQIGEAYAIHPLILEDIQNTDQRPKIEEHSQYIYLVTKRIWWDPVKKRIDSEQISFILLKNMVITFQEVPGDTFDIIRTRIREQKGRVRGGGADYLFYALVDSIVDFYFAPFEEMEEEVDRTEKKIFQKQDLTVSETLYNLTSHLNDLRRTLHPMREIFFQMQKEETPLLGKSTSLFLKDIQDHLYILADFYETLRDKITNLRAMHVTNLSDRMNNIIRILTIISTIFIPLTFIVGVYGMNFTHMPELEFRWGYFAVLGFLGILVFVMILIFKRKKWL